MLGLILLFTFLASILSLFFVGILLLHNTLIQKISFPLVSFAAGALLATAFLDTMQEAVKMAGEAVFLWVTLAIGVFFIIERLFLSLHHHDYAEDKERLRLPTPLLLFGDGLHNLIDGTSIAASFLVSFKLGLVTSIAVFIHEIPHELGDFGILIHKGWKRDRVLGFNALTGLAAFIGAILAFYLGSKFNNLVPLLLAITTGNFIYLSATDLLPEIHNESIKGLALVNTLFFLFGIFLIAFLLNVIE